MEEQRAELTFSRDQLLMANERLIKRLERLEHGVMQNYVHSASEVIEGFCQIVIDASNGNLAAKEKVEKFLDALRIAQGKSVKLPRVIETPNGPLVVEAEDKADVLDEKLDAMLNNANA